MNNAFTLSVDDCGVGRLVFDLPGEKVNKLTTPVMRELDRLLDELVLRSDIRVLVILSGKEDVFIAGADIAEIADIQSSEDAEAKSREGHAILDKLAALAFPTIAVIDGACLGGGLEFALACTYRVATDNRTASLGLPEVNLGIIPGFGGTQRLPRLIGLPNSLRMILTGKPVNGRKAWKQGLADAWITTEFMTEQTERFVADILTATGRRRVESRRRGSVWRRWLQQQNPLARWIIFRQAEKNIRKKTKGHYPAPLQALAVVRRTMGGGLAAGLRTEAREFSQLAVTPVCKNLIGLFYAQERLKKDSGIPVGAVSNAENGREPSTIGSAGVLGAGVMGGGIAWLFSNSDISVRLKDISWEAIGKGYETAAKVYRALKRLRKVDDREISLKMHRLTGTTEFTGFKRLDIVVEAVVENLDIKTSVLTELCEHVSDDTIIASNTSTLSITEMAKSVRRPERFIGMHFFNPVNRMPLVEVIPGEQTDACTVATLVTLAKKLKKTPIVVKDSPGFLVNRLLLPYLNEAVFILQEGGEVEQIDKVMVDFGMPMGPLTLIDEVGIDVAFKAAAILADAFGSRMRIAELLQILSEDEQLLGKKGGAGFYLHDGKDRELNPRLPDILDNYRHSACMGTRHMSNHEIRDRMLLTMANEAGRCIREGIVACPEYLDMAMILGTGFPACRGGILRYADEVGIDPMVSRMSELTDQYGERFQPCALFSEMSQTRVGFYTA